MVPANELHPIYLQVLAGCSSKAEWDKEAAAILAHYGGRFPRDWHAKVIASGLMSRTFERFGEVAPIAECHGLPDPEPPAPRPFFSGGPAPKG